jgi:hypothetical protein
LRDFLAQAGMMQLEFNAKAQSSQDAKSGMNRKKGGCGDYTRNITNTRQDAQFSLGR